MGCNCSDCPMRCENPFSALEGDLLKELETTKEVKVVLAGQTLVEEQHLPEGFYCVQKGSLAYYMNRRGRDYLMSVFAEGDQADISTLFNEQGSIGRLIARESSEVCCFKASEIKKLIEKSPEVALQFLSAISFHVSELRDHLEMMAVANIESKTAAGILHLQEKLGERKWSRKELAAWTGCSTEAVIRTLTKLTKEGFIDKKGRYVKILSKPHLEKLANGALEVAS